MHVPGVESCCVCVSLVLLNIICDVSANELTASDDNNRYCCSILVYLNACKLYYSIPSLITEVVTTATAVDVNMLSS